MRVKASGECDRMTDRLGVLEQRPSIYVRPPSRQDQRPNAVTLWLARHTDLDFEHRARARLRRRLCSTWNSPPLARSL